MITKAAAFRKLEAIYRDMQKGYDLCATPLGFTCAGCPRNCCTSYFQHHTHIEWTYVHKGVLALPEDARAALLARARDYEDQAALSLARGERPDAMCPANENGLCMLYQHRLMICRLHGVRHCLAGPSGEQEFPGCWRFEEAAQAQDGPTPVLDRTPLYRRLAALEMEFLGAKARRLPRVSLTLARMLVTSPPSYTP